MTNQEILNAIREQKKGRYVSFTKIKDLGNGIVKISDMVIRLGVSFANMGINKDRETGGLPWGHWVEGLENLVIEHKGKYYLRISSTNPAHPETGADVIRTIYKKDNQEITKEEALAELGEKKLKTSASSVYNIKFENIIKVGRANN